MCDMRADSLDLVLSLARIFAEYGFDQMEGVQGSAAGRPYRRPVPHRTDKIRGLGFESPCLLRRQKIAAEQSRCTLGSGIERRRQADGHRPARKRDFEPF